ncbi:hypothetical protein [Spirosoma rigui]|uniref:hypothetical protein n=1 Tax=Spirosoma rigui TaxID=564064 RepID=UPI0009B18528|nr:hypothetical protein [Spirosoma rigui]
MAKKKSLQKLTLSTKKEKDLKNQTWEMNHARITYAIDCLVTRDGIMPPIAVIAQEAGLSRQTVYEHLQSFNKSELYKNQIEAYRMLESQILAKLAGMALSGDVKAAKVFLTSIEEKRAPIETKSPNYIQINNNLKVDQLTFMNLPEVIQQKISALVQEGISYKTENQKLI